MTNQHLADIHYIKVLEAAVLAVYKAERVRAYECYYDLYLDAMKKINDAIANRGLYKKEGE